MAPVTSTARVSFTLLMAPLAIALLPVAAAAAAHYTGDTDNRLVVPVHHGGAPSVAEDRRGSLQRKSYDSYDNHYYEDTKVGGENYLAYILPALAITGLSLLFPNIVTVNTGRRRRRDADVATESEAPITELSQHMMNIYYAAIESDECMQRIACEVGAAAKSFKSENFASMISVLNASIPTKFTKLFEKFKGGMNTEKCEKLGCSILNQ